MRSIITLRQFKEEDLRSIYSLIQKTIDISYSEVYSKEAIKFFKEWHSKKSILYDAATGYTIVAEHKSEILGTGTLFGTNIRRVFVIPIHQNRGIGRMIVLALERRARIEKLFNIDLEASLVSKQFWESMGFVVQREDFVPVQNDQKLFYYKMVRSLSDNQ